MRKQLQRSQSQLNHHWWPRTHRHCRVGWPGFRGTGGPDRSWRAWCWSNRGGSHDDGGRWTQLGRAVPKYETLQGERNTCWHNIDHCCFCRFPIVEILEGRNAAEPEELRSRGGLDAPDPASRFHPIREQVALHPLHLWLMSSSQAQGTKPFMTAREGFDILSCILHSLICYCLISYECI